MTLKTTTRRAAFYLSRFFFKYYFNKFCFQLPQNVMWTDKITRAISTRTGINEVSMVTYLFIVFFEIVLGREHKGKLKKN